MKKFIRIAHPLNAADLGIATTEAEVSDSSASFEGEPHNIIYYGAPGTGKSWLLNEAAKKLDHVSRVTFYPDYSFFQFVGGYRPKAVYFDRQAELYYSTNTKAGNPHPHTVTTRQPLIDYVVVPGPLLALLLHAYQHPSETHLLIIEELNRANAAAVFGDLFQLLDRTDGVSTYAATVSIELSEWLRGEDVETDEYLVSEINTGELCIRLPANFYLWATMNSADQGVQPLDAAFKRRWAFQYVPLDSQEDKLADWPPVQLLGRPVRWNDLRRILNRFLQQQASGGARSLVPEDRLLGPFFLKEVELSDPYVLLHKLLLYLRDDLVRHNPTLVFAADAQHFSKLYDRYEKLTKQSIAVSEADSLTKFPDDLKQLFSPELATELAKLPIVAPAPTPAPADV